MKIRIRGGRLVDPSRRVDRISDLWIENGKIAGFLDPFQPSPGTEDRAIDAGGCVVGPGLIDLHVHLREPGQTQKEDIATGTTAAAAGGFTSVFCMPNTTPVNDSVETTRYILKKAQEEGRCHVFPVGAISQNLKGEALSPIAQLRRAGCLVFSDDGRPVNDVRLLRQAMLEVKAADALLMEHCEELSIENTAGINQGSVGPASLETVDVTRTLTLAAETGARVHLAHLSCAESVDLIATFKTRVSTVTSEVTPHHLALTADAVREQGANAKMYPPLRETSDVHALRRGLIKGVIDAVATDHAPHTREEKRSPFAEAPNGVIGLETALPVLLTIADAEGWTLLDILDRMSTRPAKIAGIPGGTLVVGSAADIVIFDPNEKRTIGPMDIQSKSANTPFLGFQCRGRVRLTMVDGKETYPEWTK